MEPIYKAPKVPAVFPRVTDRGMIIRPVKLKAKHDLILPDSVKSSAHEGYVMAVGENVKQQYKVGMLVVYNQLANQWITWEGVTYYMMHEESVYGQIIDDVITPMGKTIFIDQGGAEQKTEAGVILMKDNKATSVQTSALVVSVGDGVTVCKPGEKIITSIYVDFNFQFRFKTIHVAKEVDVLCVLPDKAISGTQDHGRERRKDLSYDEMPKIEKEDVGKPEGKIFHHIKKE